ncbi:TPA: hypothetical protein SL557_000163 [Pseudomonas aeruginosa]|nr:hypothetical protein [Pseudomonas aeruginosa]PBV09208.1 hypothetical protein CJU35_04960 [Pseudomonas aeruginosa]HEJ4407884.1 hypothetical protein [Pseudomonas aeruginosa]
MPHLLETSTVTVIGADAIHDWVARHLAPLCPEGAAISVIQRPWHCKGESCYFAAVEVEAPITTAQLRRLEVAEHTRGQYLHFYVDDVIAAAVGSGALAGDFFHVFYRW